MRRVKVSAKMARLRFHGCTPEYIRDVCHGACCRSSSQPSGTLISVLPEEAPALEARGARVINGRIDTPAKRCPFQTTEHLCGIHFTPDKPFGCIASPFTFNANGTLVVRNRYKMLRCYDEGPRIPAYLAFAASLKLIFGEVEAARITAHLDGGGEDLFAWVSEVTLFSMGALDALKKAPT